MDIRWWGVKIIHLLLWIFSFINRSQNLVQLLIQSYYNLITMMIWRINTVLFYTKFGFILFASSYSYSISLFIYVFNDIFSFSFIKHFMKLNFNQCKELFWSLLISVYSSFLSFIFFRWRIWRFFIDLFELFYVWVCFKHNSKNPKHINMAKTKNKRIFIFIFLVDGYNLYNCNICGYSVYWESIELRGDYLRFNDIWWRWIGWSRGKISKVIDWWVVMMLLLFLLLLLLLLLLLISLLLLQSLLLLRTISTFQFTYLFLFSLFWIFVKFVHEFIFITLLLRYRFSFYSYFLLFSLFRNNMS